MQIAQQSLKRKRLGTPVGSQSAKDNVEQKMMLVKRRLALLDSNSDKEDGHTPMVSGVGRQRIGESTSFHNNCVSALARANEVQANLLAQHPSFTKKMLKSHVIQGFWLGLPAEFCSKHLPMSNTVIVLEDENGDKYDATYLAANQGLSAGWRGFAMKHFLKVGDVVVFELVALGSKTEPPKFKVYIVRGDEFTAADGAVSLMNLETCKEGKLLQEESEDAEVNTSPGEEALLTDDNGNVSQVIGGTRLLDSDLEFEDVTSFNNFNMDVGSLDREFCEHVHKMYCELCCSQKAFLHKDVLKQLNPTLVGGMIIETIKIAEGIRACKAEGSCCEDFVSWKKTLESFELLGMNVAFLLKRIDALLSLQTQSLSECKKYQELRSETARAAKEVKALELQLSGAKDALQKLDQDMQEVESSVKKSDVALQKLATAPW